MTVLEEADMQTTGQRPADYDHPLPNHERIAAVWSMILGVDISPEKAALMMVGLKLARLAYNIEHRDSLVDLCGYARCIERILDAKKETG